MAKRLSIPRDPNEAERFLWHAIDHIMKLTPPYDTLTEAERILTHAIREVRQGQNALGNHW